MTVLSDPGPKEILSGDQIDEYRLVVDFLKSTGENVACPRGFEPPTFGSGVKGYLALSKLIGLTMRQYDYSLVPFLCQ
jgi:hypothetical protein